MQSEQVRRADLYGSLLDAKAMVDAAKYGQVATQPTRQSSIGDALASGAGKLTNALVEQLFNRGTAAAPVNYSNAFSSSGPTFDPRSFTVPLKGDLFLTAAGASSKNYSSAFGSSGPSFNPSLSFGSQK